MYCVGGRDVCLGRVGRSLGFSLWSLAKALLCWSLRANVGRRPTMIMNSFYISDIEYLLVSDQQEQIGGRDVCLRVVLLLVTPC